MIALDKLGLAIANAGYTWTPEMRQAYEDGIKELKPAAWLIGDKVFRTLTEAENYKRMFTHHTIEPLYRNV